MIRWLRTQPVPADAGRLRRRVDAGARLLRIRRRPPHAGIGRMNALHSLVRSVDTASGHQLIGSGKLRAIGIASPKRVKNFESIPTLAEQGLEDFEAHAWQGLVAPAGTPPAVVETLDRALLAAMDTTAVKARLQALGLEAIPSSPTRMGEYAAAERAKWGRVIKANDIRVD
jgi:tripartite-type tricarboxylate transporter receptor subunit TctC